MEASITTEHLEWLIWTELPIRVQETECWGAIICQECGPKIKEWPNRCKLKGDKLTLNLNKFVQRMISHIKVKCKFCENDFERGEILQHMEDCDQNKLKPVFINPVLHPCVLYKKEKSNSWYWDGSKIISQGWAISGSSKTVSEKGTSWYCSRCDADFWEGCIQKYAEVDDYAELRQFTKDSNMHLSHCHPFSLYFGVNLQDSVRQNWYGKYKEDGCKGRGATGLRYMVCFDWKFLLCEKCYLSPPTDYIKVVQPELHKHILHLQSIPSSSTWGCDSKSANCIKLDHATNKAWRISYRWDVWDFDWCLECIKAKVIK